MSDKITIIVTPVKIKVDALPEDEEFHENVSTWEINHS